MLGSKGRIHAWIEAGVDRSGYARSFNDSLESMGGVSEARNYVTRAWDRALGNRKRSHFEKSPRRFSLRQGSGTVPAEVDLDSARGPPRGICCD